MLTIEQRIWDWLPARRTRARVTTPVVAAANLDLSVDAVAAAFARMHTARQIVPDPRGGWHRGLPPSGGHRPRKERGDGMVQGR